MALLAGAKVAYRTELAIMERAQQKQLALYDTLTRSLRPVVSLDGEGYRIYCCGPTVYRDAHVGNLRTFLLADMVRRTLLFLGNKVTVVQNITDVGHMTVQFEGVDELLAGLDTTLDLKGENRTGATWRDLLAAGIPR